MDGEGKRSRITSALPEQSTRNTNQRLFDERIALFAGTESKPSGSVWRPCQT
jgi:hypothetical protein